MKVGISTASLFSRYKTEDALKFLSNSKVNTVEVFLESFCEYNTDFGKIINANKGNLDIHSVHTLTTQFEPQLYSINERAREDSFKFLEDTMKTAQLIGAKYYTFHGGARFKKTPLILNLDKVGKETQEVIDVCSKYGVTLAYENVHWGYYNYIGFFNEMRKRTCGLKGTFDIKQARQSGIDYAEYIKEMGKDIATVHISDVDEDGKMCLPLKGVTDFNNVFSLLRDVGFDGAILLEVYPGDFNKESELLDCLNKVETLATKIFNG